MSSRRKMTAWRRTVRAVVIIAVALGSFAPLETAAANKPDLVVRGLVVPDHVIRKTNSDTPTFTVKAWIKNIGTKAAPPSTLVIIAVPTSTERELPQQELLRARTPRIAAGIGMRLNVNVTYAHAPLLTEYGILVEANREREFAELRTSNNYRVDRQAVLAASWSGTVAGKRAIAFSGSGQSFSSDETWTAEDATFTFDHPSYDVDPRGRRTDVRGGFYKATATADYTYSSRQTFPGVTCEGSGNDSGVASGDPSVLWVGAIEEYDGASTVELVFTISHVCQTPDETVRSEQPGDRRLDWFVTDTDEKRPIGGDTLSGSLTTGTPSNGGQNTWTWELTAD